ncbi:MAG: acetylxylan esterase [Planctomycetia bacterium]|nr:acetylxylan esterase [Planctomycetia bacterium]
MKRRMVRFLLCLFFAGGVLAGETSSKPQAWVNEDETKVPAYTLPDVFLCEDGSTVATKQDWLKKRRPELLRLLTREMYGEVPAILQTDHPDFIKYEVMEEDRDALGGKAIRRQVAIHFYAPGEEARHNGSATGPVRKSDIFAAGASSRRCLTVNVLLYLPKKADHPVPCFLGMNFNGNQTVCDDTHIFMSEYFEKGQVPEKKRRGMAKDRWCVEKILDAGYGLVTCYYENIVPDRVDGLDSGIFSLYGPAPDQRKDSDWGAIAAWAWALSRIMDYIEQDPELDTTRVIVMGHSRLGKTALWAGACDPRFAAVISNNSGCGGAALSRREFGERVVRINDSFPHWFARKFHTYGEDVNRLPFDQHALLALVAPRPLYVASAEQDRWADPKGEYLATLEAAKVYRLFGIAAFGDAPQPELPAVNMPLGEGVRYHIRTGKHDVTAFDWDQYLRFADQNLKEKTPRYGGIDN